ncbi:DUF58 domain-containing protein [Prolixibacter denitrificans]|uniref:DUF58 domain-containing protein n=1 Tax=Prolixibacter denitrificans TaxID=1541063 RepID=UPI001FE3BD80|nr:DUF58 domain-containing protein [Prolixibacter denitrificans]
MSRNIFAGEYHSAFKGRGMAFSEVREYQFGDDVRNIDWNVTARYNKPFIKVFEEERELTVMLMIDVSGSREFGTAEKLKKNVITEIGAILSFSAISNNDKIGVIFFSDKIEKFIPPQKGRTHTLRIIRELIEFQPESKQTDIAQAMQYLTNVMKRRVTAFVISDFMDNNPELEKAIRIANSKHDVVGLQIYDERETELPSIGMVKFKDAESGEYLWVDSSSRKVREAYQKWWNDYRTKLDIMMKRSGVDYVGINTRDDYVKSLVSLFKKREQ